MSDQTAVPTMLYSVAVSISRNATTNELAATYAPPIVNVGPGDSIISYFLASAPVGVLFWGLNIEPSTQRDFGPPSITLGGRMITIHDANTDKAVTRYNVTLWLTDPVNGTVPIDPQIINRPGRTDGGA